MGPIRVDIPNELAYWLKARRGGAHCALCDITHGSVREKPEWRTCRAQLPVPIETVHLNERDPDLAAFTRGQEPCVVAKTTIGYVMLVDRDALQACDGSPECLIETIATNATALDLDLRVS